MTGAELLSQVRLQFDDPSTAFIETQEGYDYIWQGLYELCAKSNIRKIIDTSITTVNGTVDYAMPESFIKIQQITWDDDLLFRRDLEKFQGITGGNPSTGNPQWYVWWGKTLSLTPTPSTAKTIKIWGYGRPTKITSANASTDIFTNDGIEEAYQQDVIDYVLMRVYYKDDDQKALQHRTLWEASLERIQLEEAQKRYGDNHVTVTVTDDVGIVWSQL